MHDARNIEAFRRRVGEFIAASLAPALRRAGRMATSIFCDFDAAMAWHRILYSKGWVAPEWPQEYGGAGWSASQREVFREECRRAHAPALLPMGLQMLGPILMRYGTPEQKREHLPRILSGDDVWCQGYSEPQAGSDLSSLKTRATRDRDGYLVDGSKIWTSYAHRANKIFCLVRTRFEGKPQAGISFLLMDLHAPGVTVQPIVGLDGREEQCQVFFERVRVPFENLVGEENQGWEVAKYLLEFERGGYCYYSAIERQGAQVRDLIELQFADAAMTAAERERIVAEHRLAEIEVETLALEHTERRLWASLDAGGSPGTFSSMVKLLGTELSQRVDELALSLAPPWLAVKQDHVLRPDFSGTVVGPEAAVTVMPGYLNNRAATIYGGSAEMQRNILAKLVLGPQMQNAAMASRFSDDQMLLETSIGRYLDQRYDWQRSRAHASSDAGRSVPHWRSFAELGWLSIPVAEAFGGQGRDPVEILILFEHVGRHLVVEPLLETALIGGFWLTRGDAAAAELLAPMMSGELQLAFAHFEPTSMARPKVARTLIERTRTGLRLSGSKSVVYNAPLADCLIVSALEVDRLCFVLVPTDAAGVTLQRYQTFDGRCAAEVSFDDVTLPPSAQLAVGASEDALEEVLDLVRLALAAETLGIATTLVEKTVAYAAERRQFGQRLNEFQVLRHRMVDMYVQSQVLRSIVLAAACAMRESREDASELLAACKIKANWVGRFVSHSAFQIHGAIATTDELSIGHYLKRLTVIAGQYGSTDSELHRFQLLRAARRRSTATGD